MTISFNGCFETETKIKVTIHRLLINKRMSVLSPHWSFMFSYLTDAPIYLDINNK